MIVLAIVLFFLLFVTWSGTHLIASQQIRVKALELAIQSGARNATETVFVAGDYEKFIRKGIE